MELKDILAISGHGGLFKFVSQGRNGIIVESLVDKKRISASATAKISALEDIAIYTDVEEISLADVFTSIYNKEDGNQTISHKSSSNELKAYFEEVLPEYDKDRVYVSDIKKVLNWYNILQSLDMVKPSEKKDEENNEEEKSAE
ncbi:MAG: DUF5606 domain-containing protein [Bacteroidales bacterium]|jgi:hypothetical protein|nr:DUF5606 domain-containing protein [Bacteroidales bacterium]